ncbi:S8 family serine peptidase [Pacificimonas sp. WHA3]|uniref:S8 family serine peptidase n=1 Tax=Pacificimonas pallii TaxID=2827236 RepID=A0ABS6SB64_9SPHN|nr:S8 family peptidase [Pacificimonas pallii]MBV7255595.1 S8 family serine peptidase [Pacificimonas pallii]
MAKKPSQKKADTPAFEGEAELIVMMREETDFRASAGRFESLAGDNINDIEKALKKHGAEMHPLFGPTEERVQTEMMESAEANETEMLDGSHFYKVAAPEGKMEALQEDLMGHELVEAAYIKPPSEPPEAPEGINEMIAAPDEAPPASPNFTSRQIYLNAPSAGINTPWAWGRPGGRGRNVRIIDIEGAWRFTHEDLRGNQGGVVGGTQSTDIRWRNHGTAVLGVYSGDRNGFGVTGIVPDARASAVSIFGGPGSAGAINIAASRLRRGDIMLLELHRPGPRHNFQNRNDQKGYIAIEWWPDDFTAIRNAVNRGILVVEAAGNGAENLDDSIYQTAATGFPASWSNSFRRSNRDSGAIVVGAGAPPPGTHGRNHGPDRSRLDFSNYGRLVDAQGWGREVTTCGYGDRQGGSNEDLWYTDIFSGTSSASPIVVGACASIQGMVRARGRTPVTPARMRSCLRRTGSVQNDAPGRPRSQRIGRRPDIRALYNCLFGVVGGGGKNIVKDLKDGRKDVKEKDFKERGKDIIKDKDFKERGKDVGKDLGKDIKEKDKDKDIFENKRFENKVREGIHRGRLNVRRPEDHGYDAEYDGQDGQGGGHDDNLDARMSAMEAAMGELMHFIGGDLRPDLGGGHDDGHDDDIYDEDWADDGGPEGYDE